jgi:hypothetical protein
MELRASFADKSWELQGRGGELIAGGLPPLELVDTHLRQRERDLFIQSANFNARGGGTISATGEVHFDEKVDLQARLDGIDIQPLLPEDWRAKLYGRAAGEIRVQTALPVKGAVAVSGSLQLRDGRLEALPVLNQIALFTRTQQFRQVPLTEASADFRREHDTLQVSKLVAESAGLLRIEGGFTVAKGQIDGTFQVGVAPSTLQWIPGSQERVFTAARGSYLWTTMRSPAPWTRRAKTFPAGSRAQPVRRSWRKWRLRRKTSIALERMPRRERWIGSFLAPSSPVSVLRRR